MGKASQNIFEWIDKIAKAHVAQIQKYIDKKRYDAIINHASSYKGCDYKCSIRILSPNEFVVTVYPTKKCSTLIGLNGDIRKQAEYNSATKYYQINNGASLFDNPDRYVIMLPNGKEYHKEDEPVKEEVYVEPDKKVDSEHVITNTTNTLDDDDYTDDEDINENKFDNIKTPGNRSDIIIRLVDEEMLKIALNRAMYEMLFNMKFYMFDFNNLSKEDIALVNKLMQDIEEDTINKLTRVKKLK